MDHYSIIPLLQANREVFQSLLGGLPADMVSWKPEPGKWCLLEVVCHLYDEEREDFRARVKHTLNTPDQPMPPIDPQGWVTSRNYMQQSFQQRLDQFLAERDASIEWLKGLKDPDWSSAYHHPKLGVMTAWMFLCNWLAHDYLHIRQITGLKHGYLAHTSNTDLSYAGNW